MIPLPDIDAAEGTTRPWDPRIAAFELDEGPPPGRPPIRRRSLFEEDFDLPPRAEAPPEPEIITPTFSLAEYEACREEAWQAGQAAERDAIRAADSIATRDALAAIATHLGAARADSADIAGEAAEALAQLLLDTLAALFPALCARFGSAEAAAVARAILPALRLEPHATIRLAPALVPAITDTIQQADPSLLERLDILPDIGMAAGDIRIAWRTGAARRDVAELWTEIGDILGQAGWPPVPARIKETIDVK